jgi:hydroxymethylpyrimidine/phosphomethylpyrimidine kinase
MLATPAIIDAVADGLADFRGPIVLDPVMVAKSGDALLHDDAVSCLIERLLPRASLLTPNIPEAGRLLSGKGDLTPQEQGKALLALGPAAILMKGGHADGAVCHDYLVTESQIIGFDAPRIDTGNTHGTGCSLSSAIAAGLAKNLALDDAIGTAHQWLHGAIKAADQLGIGQGHGPVHHFHQFWS